MPRPEQCDPRCAAGVFGSHLHGRFLPPVKSSSSRHTIVSCGQILDPVLLTPPRPAGMRSRESWGSTVPEGPVFRSSGVSPLPSNMGGTPMTHPSRGRRGRPAQSRTDDHPSPAKPDQAPDTPSRSPASGVEPAGRGQLVRARRGIARPPRVDSTDEPNCLPTSQPGSLGTSAPGARLLYTAEQAAALLQVRPSWLRRKAAARAIPCRFLGKHLRFSRTDLETIAANSATTRRSRQTG
jgi:excisionase family DNA binding protein